MDRYNPANFAIPSTGDDDKDRQTILDYVKSSALMDEGMCPNGCGPRIPWDQDPGASICPVCGFFCNRPV